MRLSKPMDAGADPDRIAGLDGTGLVQGRLQIPRLGGAAIACGTAGRRDLELGRVRHQQRGEQEYGDPADWNSTTPNSVRHDGWGWVRQRQTSALRQRPYERTERVVHQVLLSLLLNY